jgi:5-formyltetrahydrofolate cyclo-ligase
LTDNPKRDLRLHYLAARLALTPDQREDQDSRVRDHLRSLINERRPGTVAAYVPIAGEPGGPELVTELSTEVQRLLLPVLLADFDLDWAAYQGYLAPASRGLVEPDGPRLGVSAIGQADLVVAPGLAVARDGMRLGRGGGSYDRALTRVLPTTLVVTLLYDGELIDSVPAEIHDRRVGGAVTPEGVVLFPQ